MTPGYGLRQRKDREVEDELSDEDREDRKKKIARTDDKNAGGAESEDDNSNTTIKEQHVPVQTQLQYVVSFGARRVDSDFYPFTKELFECTSKGMLHAATLFVFFEVYLMISLSTGNFSETTHGAGKHTVTVMKSLEDITFEDIADDVTSSLSQMTPPIAFDEEKHIVMILAPITDKAAVTLDKTSRPLTYRKLVEMTADWHPSSKRGSYFVIVPRSLQPKPPVVKHSKKSSEEQDASSSHNVSVSVSWGGKKYEGRFLVDSKNGSKSHTRLLSTETMKLPVGGQKLREVASRILLNSDLQTNLSEEDHILAREIVHEAPAGPKSKSKDQPMLPQAIPVVDSINFDTEYNQKVIKLVIMEKNMKEITYQYAGGSESGGGEQDRDFAIRRWAAAALVDRKLHKVVKGLDQVLIDGNDDPARLAQLIALAALALTTASTPSKPSVTQWKTAIEAELTNLPRDAATQDKLPSGITFSNVPVRSAAPAPPPVTPAGRGNATTQSSAQSKFNSIADDAGFVGVCQARLSGTVAPIKSFKMDSLIDIARTYTLDLQLSQSCGPGEKFKSGWWFRLKKIGDGDAPEFFLECVESGCKDKIKVLFERLLQGSAEDEDDYFDENSFSAV